jgi:DNA-directed RNA polymerase subunit RPC12/RpoP
MLQIDSFPFLFSFVFILVFAFIIVSVIINFIRVLKKPPQSQSEESGAIVREREIIREIVKIRCPYCNNLYEEKYDKCPHCGGKRGP